MLFICFLLLFGYNKTKHHLIEEAISARSAGFSFLKNKNSKKKIPFFEKQLHSPLPNIYIYRFNFAMLDNRMALMQ